MPPVTRADVLSGVCGLTVVRCRQNAPPPPRNARHEAQCHEHHNQARLQARQTRSREVLEKLRTWLDETRPLVTPKSELGKALRYLDHYWDRLVRYTERGDLPMDNNRVENAIRPFVVGRKNWLFSDTPAGAHASAVVYSLIETARANGREPHTWLRHVLRKLPHAGTVDDYEALLPWNLSLEVLALETVGAE